MKFTKIFLTLISLLFLSGCSLKENLFNNFNNDEISSLSLNLKNNDENKCTSQIKVKDNDQMEMERKNNKKTIVNNGKEVGLIGKLITNGNETKVENINYKYNDNFELDYCHSNNNMLFNIKISDENKSKKQDGKEEVISSNIYTTSFVLDSTEVQKCSLNEKTVNKTIYFAKSKIPEKFLVESFNVKDVLVISSYPLSEVDFIKGEFSVCFDETHFKFRFEKTILD